MKRFTQIFNDDYRYKNPGKKKQTLKYKDNLETAINRNQVDDYTLNGFIMALENEKLYDESINFFKLIERQWPQLLGSFTITSLIKINLKKEFYGEAEEVWDKYKRKLPKLKNCPQAVNEIMKVYINTQKYQSAIDVFKQCSRPDKQCRYRKLTCLARMKDSGGVISLLNEKGENSIAVADDKKLARLIADFEKENLLDVSITLFETMKAKNSKMIGNWTVTAMIGIYRKQNCLDKSKEIWEKHKESCPSFKNDPWAIIEIMQVHIDEKNFKAALDIFNQCTDRDVQCHMRKLTCLIQLNDTTKLKMFFDEAKKDKVKIDQPLYSHFVTKIYPVDSKLAESTFRDALAEGFFKNNIMEEVGEKEAVLNFHLHRNAHKFPGGVTVAVAKVAFKVFLDDYIKTKQAVPARLITGGKEREESQSKRKLKYEVPDYLQEKFAIKGEWDENRSMLQFYLSHAQLLKADTMQKVYEFLEAHDEEFENPEPAIQAMKHNSTYQRMAFLLEHDLRVGIRHHRQNVKPNTQRPIIPDYFTEDERSLAEAALTCYDNKRFLESIEKLEALIDLHQQEQSWTHAQLGWLYHKIRNHSEAIVQYEKALSINDQGHYDVSRKLGWVYDRKARFGNLSKGQKDKLYAKAISFYRSELDKFPENHEVLNNWGITLKNMLKSDEAIMKFQLLIAKNPEHDEAYVHIGDCQLKMKRYNDALESYKKAIEINEKREPNIKDDFSYARIGNLYLKLYQAKEDKEMLHKAKYYLDMALKINPKNDKAQQTLSDIFNILGESDNAQIAQQQATVINPFAMK